MGMSGRNGIGTLALICIFLFTIVRNGKAQDQFIPIQAYGYYQQPGSFTPLQGSSTQQAQPSLLQQQSMRQSRFIDGPFVAAPAQQFVPVFPQAAFQPVMTAPVAPMQFGTPQFVGFVPQPVASGGYMQPMAPPTPTEAPATTPEPVTEPPTTPPPPVLVKKTKVSDAIDSNLQDLDVESRSVQNTTTSEQQQVDPNGNKTDTIPKSQLFSFNPVLSDPTSIEALKSQVKLTRFQIWWITNQILPQVSDRLRPDYVLMLPTPFQQGIPTANISQILISPVVRHETLRTLIDVAEGFLPSQLAVLLQRIRLSEPPIIRSILGSSNPSVLFSQINPREIKKNINTVVKTITDMPETGRFGITSVQAKLLPPTLLSIWLRSVNQSRWTALDLLGQSPMGAAHELQLAILGLTCQDVRTLTPNDLLPVTNYFRRELYSLRFFQDLSFPMSLRRCLMDKLLEFLANKPGNSPHILDKLNPAEVKAIGGEVLTSIPTAALKKVNPHTKYFIIGEIGRLDPISLIKFGNLKKLQWYAQTLFGVNDADVEAAEAEAVNAEGRSIDEDPFVDDFPEFTAHESEDAKEEPQAAEESQDLEGDGIAEDEMSAENGTEAKVRHRRSHQGLLTDKLHHMGSLYCYSTSLLDSKQDSKTIRDFFDQKESIGERTCCMSKAMRKKWNTFLKGIYGTNVTSWSEFDLSSLGDLLIALSEREIRALSLDNLSKVVASLIKQSGFNKEVRLPGHTTELSFIKACGTMLPDDEAEQIGRAYKALYKKFAQSAQWLLSTSQNTTDKNKLKITCDGLINAGPAGVGYTANDLMTMESKEMFDCIETLGTLDFDEDIKFELLQHFRENFHLSGTQMNILTLIELGKLVPEITATDVSEMPLFLPEALDSVAVMGTQINNIDLLKAIGTKFTADNRILPGLIGSRSVNFRVVIRALGNILCGLNEHVVSSILDSDATIMLDTSPELGIVEGCSQSILNIIAAHAMRPANYGPPESWSLTDVRTLGVVVAGLTPDLITRIPPNSMEGLTPLAVRSLPPESIQVLTPHQLFRITSDAALAIDFSHTEIMSQEQKDALMVTIAVDRDTFFVHHRTSKGNTRLFAGFMGDSEDEKLQDLPSKPIESRLGPKEKNATSTSKSSKEPIDSKSSSNATSEVEGRSVGSNSTVTNGTETETIDILAEPDAEGMDITEDMRSVNGSETLEGTNGTMETNGTTATTVSMNETATTPPTEPPRHEEEAATTPKPSSATRLPLNSILLISSMAGILKYLFL